MCRRQLESTGTVFAAFNDPHYSALSTAKYVVKELFVMLHGELMD
ncbi:hypothetical protein HMPREF1861_00094 [Corynebacterium kroppenstedtii]|nr:hypothetical protein HMPREF1861_00094 [Corynebacterium kroppenstedtii]